MNTADLVERVAVERGVAMEHVRKILDSAFAAIIAVVENGEDVALSGFGRFKLSSRAARQGRNPTTVEMIEIPPPGSSLHRRQIRPFRSQRHIRKCVVAKAKTSVDA